MIWPQECQDARHERGLGGADVYDVRGRAGVGRDSFTPGRDSFTPGPPSTAWGTTMQQPHALSAHGFARPSPGPYAGVTGYLPPQSLSQQQQPPAYRMQPLPPRTAAPHFAAPPPGRHHFEQAQQALDRDLGNERTGIFNVSGNVTGNGPYEGPGRKVAVALNEVAMSASLSPYHGGHRSATSASSGPQGGGRSRYKVP
jgi:hypothetical protein